MRYQEHITRCAAMAVAVLIFTFFDGLVHNSIAWLAVPEWYFTHKIIYGTLWACLTSLFVTTWSIPKQATAITLVTVSFLQIRYILWGYPWVFHLIVFPEHLFFLFIASYGVLRMQAKTIKPSR